MDIVNREKRSQMMAGIRGKNTKPEVLIRKLLHACGFRFRLHDKTLPGKPDIILKRHKVVVCVDGCFWHGHQGCHLFKIPKSNTDFWKDKIESNIRRDGKVTSEILDMGWRLIRVRECAIKGKTRLDLKEIEVALTDFICGNGADSIELTGRN